MPSSSQKGGMWPFENPSSSNSSYTMENGMYSGVLQYFYYFIIVTIIILLVLVLVNYTITPVFRLNPGDKGIISLPGSNDSVLYWTDSKKIVPLKDIDTVVGTSSENWSMLLDLQVDDPTAHTGMPRVLFSRGPAFNYPSSYPSGSNILRVNPTFNLCIYIDPLLNDLFVCVQTVKNSEPQPVLQIIKVPNVPVGKGLRLGVFVGSKVLEVYVNGYLLSSKAFPESLKSIIGGFQPPSDTIMANTAQVLNLRLWPRPVSSAEFRSYGASDANFTKKALSDSCVAK
jgi:hypothetical protein